MVHLLVCEEIHLHCIFSRSLTRWIFNEFKEALGDTLDKKCRRYINGFILFIFFKLNQISKMTIFSWRLVIRRVDQFSYLIMKERLVCAIHCIFETLILLSNNITLHLDSYYYYYYYYFFHVLVFAGLGSNLP